jgi:hypothetical protein
MPSLQPFKTSRTFKSVVSYRSQLLHHNPVPFPFSDPPHYLRLHLLTARSVHMSDHSEHDEPESMEQEECVG